MKTHKSLFAGLLDHLSGTCPNDERTSRINEKGFALCGLFYIAAFPLRLINDLLHPYNDPPLYMVTSDRIVFGVMLLIMLCITIKQRLRETPVQEKKTVKFHLTELPRTAAALLSGKSPEDERTVLAFERGFAVCGLIGLTYLLSCTLFATWCPYFYSTFFLLFAAPVLIGIVKLRDNILTPPRAVHIRLNTRHFLLRLPVYLLDILPFVLLARYICYFPEVYDNLIEPIVIEQKYSDNLFIMTLQVFRDSVRDCIGAPFQITRGAWINVILLFVLIVLFHEWTVWLYRRQMKKMDAEENDLS